MPRQEVVDLRDLLRIQVVAAPADTVVAKVAVRVWAAEAAEVVTAPADAVVAFRAVPVAAEVRVAVRVWVADAVVVAVAPARTAVAHRAILVVAEDRVTVAGKAGPEDAVRAVPRTPDTAAEVVVAMSHRAVPAVVVAGKVGQEAGVAVKMWAVDLVEVVAAVDPTTAAVATLPLRDNGIHGVSNGRTRCHLQDTDELAHRASTAMPAVPASFSRSLFVL